MVAVLTVFANHLWNWPSGGFIGVDVFFVISGFLITGNLLRDAEKRGTVSFQQFYWNRVRRIVPAATVVLLLTYLAAVLVFLPFRAREVGVDAIFAFAFLSNWWFGFKGTDYFRASTDTVSPLQHYWSLSIEEQFYFVWPALIFLISVFVLRKAWTHQHRMQLAAAAMGGIVAVSLGWAIYRTHTAAIAAYFDTFSRVWELGVGALLACSVGLLERIPTALKPLLSWAGLGLIVASLFLLSDGASGFPAPWALLPVAGAALVIAAGVGGEPQYQAFLRNPLSGYIGDVSYSLYLVHWPIIVIVAELMNSGPGYDLAIIALGFGLAIASYHFVENPLRKADWSKFRYTAHEIRRRRYAPQKSIEYAAVAALSLIAVGVTAFAIRPVEPPTLPPSVIAQAPEAEAPGTAPVGPLGAELQNEIGEALKATEWPNLTPPMEQAIGGQMAPSEVVACGQVDLYSVEKCTWGSPDAPFRMFVVGDSIALAYAGPLTKLVADSNGQMQVHVAPLAGCQFSNDQIFNADEKSVAVNYPRFCSDLYRRIRNMPRQYSPEFRDRALRMLD
ncbi:acyltransferase family protein, partial [Mycolicibacterium psychrotolerans]